MEKKGSCRRNHCFFHDMNIQASTRDFAGVVQTILKRIAFYK